MSKEIADTLITGYAGESIAQTRFTKIGWAPPTKLIQDVGDDFITFARGQVVAGSEGISARVYDLSAPVFLQIKASGNDYRAPSHEERGEPGWWYDESDIDDFDHWLRFGLPYLLVLIDEDAEVAYWQEVTGQTIVSTGKGRKIFVPENQRVMPDSLDLLNHIAVAARSNPLEGTLWEGLLDSLQPSDHLRNALILPRVVAPHPNQSAKPITYEQAAALLMRNREAPRRLAEEGHCPAPPNLGHSPEVGWRFVGALWDVLNGQPPSLLASLGDRRRLAHERDAALVVQACWDYVNGSAADAVNRLKPSRNSKPADRAWILGQRAAFLLARPQGRSGCECARGPHRASTPGRRPVCQRHPGRLRRSHVRGLRLRRWRCRGDHHRTGQRRSMVESPGRRTRARLEPRRPLPWMVS